MAYSKFVRKIRSIRNSKVTKKCLVCGKPMEYTPQYCCDGKDCDCRGEPINHQVCCEVCWNAILNSVNNKEDK